MSSKLKLMMTTFTVEGTGSFPTDMLRYDQCWPTNESHDSKAIANSFSEHNIGAPWKIGLTTVGLAAPTVDRWASFGWKVIPESINARRL